MAAAVAAVLPLLTTATTLCRYIAKAAEYFGVTKTRDIYEKAINTLSPAQASRIECNMFSIMYEALPQMPPDGQDCDHVHDLES